ncbi:uncharacterized protein LOC115948476 isoform X4 [Geospiza fortis]|uniref:Uncharacterized protein LOC115948476 isoform X4 n=1 Tax=Geospiza fortis TaxID=48883 RepID=A0A8N5EZN7_GEOFO|nr:uncharacterized protein LOC115948476 isoform X4 [Geospiza fortis]
MILPLLDKYFQRTASQSLTQTEQHLSGGKKSIQEDLVTHCNLSQMNLQVFAASLFLTWMCSVICFPHSTETGTAEGLGARRAGARDTSSGWAAKDGGGVLPARAVAPGTRHPSLPLAPRDLLLLGEARISSSSLHQEKDFRSF